MNSRWEIEAAGTAAKMATRCNIISEWLTRRKEPWSSVATEFGGSKANLPSKSTLTINRLEPIGTRWKTRLRRRRHGDGAGKVFAYECEQNRAEPLPARPLFDRASMQSGRSLFPEHFEIANSPVRCVGASVHRMPIIRGFGSQFRTVECRRNNRPDDPDIAC